MCQLKLPESGGDTEEIYFDSHCCLLALTRQDNRMSENVWRPEQYTTNDYYLSAWQLNNNKEFSSLYERRLGLFLEVSQVKFDDEGFAFYSTCRRKSREDALYIEDYTVEHNFWMFKNGKVEVREKIQINLHTGLFVIEKETLQSCHFNYESGFIIQSSKDINK